MFIPIPFDCSEGEIYQHIPTDPFTESMGFVDDEQIVVLETVNGNFFHQQKLFVWTSLPCNSPRPELNRLVWLYHFLANRPQRAIVYWRDRCWQVEKTQRSIPVIKRLLRWERKHLFTKIWIYLSPILSHEHYMHSALRYALNDRDLDLDNKRFLAKACGVSTRVFHFEHPETIIPIPTKVALMRSHDRAPNHTNCDMLNSVRDFHLHIGAAVSDVPQLLACSEESAIKLAQGIRQLIQNNSTSPTDQLSLRAHLALEELAEWLDAHADGDIVAAADAWADRAYVLFGDAVATGLPATELFQEVHRSNMTKSGTGQTGKGIKGDEYQPPNIGPLLT